MIEMNEKQLINEMVRSLHIRGVHWMAIEGALREFKRKHPHFSKNVAISYYMDALKKVEAKAKRKFRERR